MKKEFPAFYLFMQPIVAALHHLGGSATSSELSDVVFALMKLTDRQLGVVHESAGGMREADYRLSCACHYLEKFGAIERSRRGVWSLAKGFSWVRDLDYRRVLLYVNSTQRPSPPAQGLKQEFARCGSPSSKTILRQSLTESPPLEEPLLPWREQLMEELLSLSSSAFERLTMRILRECGFVQVEVTGKPGDRGIDGKGIVKLNNIMSFHMVFQCKRMRRQVTPDLMRDFRGAMAGNAEKGLFITTGSFTREAREEANKPGTPPIDLIDGEGLMDLLCELQLGLKPVLTYEVDASWFESL